MFVRMTFICLVRMSRIIFVKCFGVGCKFGCGFRCFRILRLSVCEKYGHIWWLLIRGVFVKGCNIFSQLLSFDSLFWFCRYCFIRLVLFSNVSLFSCVFWYLFVNFLFR